MHTRVGCARVSNLLSLCPSLPTPTTQPPDSPALFNPSRHRPSNRRPRPSRPFGTPKRPSIPLTLRLVDARFGASSAAVAAWTASLAVRPPPLPPQPWMRADFAEADLHAEVAEDKQNSVWGT
eukprot:2704760-Rhodomonas_salina.2